MIMATIIVAVADTTFIQGVVTAILSALVSGGFLLVSVHMTNRRTDSKVQEATKEIIQGQQDVKNEVKKEVVERITNGGSE